MIERNNSYEKHYQEKFGWKRDYYIGNLGRLAEISQTHGIDPIMSFPSLFITYSDNPLDAMRYSIQLLTYEATICFVYGVFQACILTCGAAVERVLKVEYMDKNQQLPRKGKWTLGNCIYKLNWSGTGITNEILNYAKPMVDPRNSRIHMLF